MDGLAEQEEASTQVTDVNVPQSYGVKGGTLAGFAPFVSMAPVICSSSVCYLECELDAPDAIIDYRCEDRKMLRR
jgi:hypothetical protein